MYGILKGELALFDSVASLVDLLVGIFDVLALVAGSLIGGDSQRKLGRPTTVSRNAHAGLACDIEGTLLFVGLVAEALFALGKVAARVVVRSFRGSYHRSFCGSYNRSFRGRRIDRAVGGHIRVRTQLIVLAPGALAASTRGLVGIGIRRRGNPKESLGLAQLLVALVGFAPAPAEAWIVAPQPKLGLGCRLQRSYGSDKDEHGNRNSKHRDGDKIYVYIYIYIYI